MGRIFFCKNFCISCSVFIKYVDFYFKPLKMNIQMSTNNYYVNLVLIGIFCAFSLSDAEAQDTPPANKNAIALYNDGLAALREKNYKSGFTVLDSAYTLAKQENNAEVMGLAKKNVVFAAYNHGSDLLKSKNPKGALAIFQRGLAIDETSGLLHQGIGKAKEDMGDAEGAVKSYVTSLEMAKAEKDEKKIADAQTRVKNLLIKQLQAKAYAKVIKIGTEYLPMDNSSSITYLIGKAYADKGDNTNGIKYLLQTVELSNTAGEKIEDKVYYGLGVAYDNVKDSKNAIKYLSMVTDPKYKPSVTAIITRLKAAK
jgi:tetratricopeptide (TPR) repeat protein